MEIPASFKRSWIVRAVKRSPFRAVVFALSAIICVAWSSKGILLFPFFQGYSPLNCGMVIVCLLFRMLGFEVFLGA